MIRSSWVKSKQVNTPIINNHSLGAVYSNGALDLGKLGRPGPNAHLMA